MNPLSCIFFFSIYNPKEVRVLTNLIFLVLDLAAIMGLLAALKYKYFLILFFDITLISYLEEFQPVKYLLSRISTSRKLIKL